MIVLSASNISKVYGIDVILDKVSFSLNAGEKVGIIGDNGAGKSTLMKILAGVMPYDEGDIFTAADVKIGYLAQSDNFDFEGTLISEVNAIFAPIEKMEEELFAISAKIEEAGKNGTSEETDRLLESYDKLLHEYEQAGGYSYKSEITGVLSSMAFTESRYNKRISELSGGEKTRLALACLLLKKPDILFLDEPTNHLDIGTLKWLEQYIRSYNGSVVMITHDRYFLDQTVSRIFEVENHKVYSYEGTYSDFIEAKKLRQLSEQRRYEQNQKEIERQEEMIRRFKGHGTEKLAKRAASREKKLAKMEKIERPAMHKASVRMEFTQNFQSGNDVIAAEGLSKCFGFGDERQELFSGVDFEIKRGERVCIVGANGIGKTTLLKIIMQEIRQDAGRIKIGHNVEFAYYDQEQQSLNPRNTVFEEMKEAYRLYTDAKMRGMLGRFLFSNDSVFLQVSSLSGGEKARLALLKLMLSGANVLVLDEPTNHLDISSKEVFEEALNDYEGTVIAVSHDRYFLNKIATRIIELKPDGIVSYIGGYDYYMQKKQDIVSTKQYVKELAMPEKKDEVQGKNSAQERRLKKEADTKRRRTERKIKETEEEIAALTKRINDIHEAMCNPDILADHMKLLEYQNEVNSLNVKLEEKEEEWLKLQEE
ncbi:MAG: ABC-F family ATP-binding cassette domain-containing protein [Clostridiales bacterium]|nr:ABC-F family ATP-binding cassette domain-containing protein [Clostridiales bacterium]